MTGPIEGAQDAVEARAAEAAKNYAERKATRPNGGAILEDRVASAPTYVPAYTKGLKIMDGEELLKASFPPRNVMLAPWLPDKGLAMIYGTRGVGKTWFALSIAHAIASGGEFLCWRAPRPRRVVYFD
jgi:DNA replication protein DnaC